MADWETGEWRPCLKGISQPALQRLLDHDTLLTTEIYLNLSPEHVFEEFQQKW